MAAVYEWKLPDVGEGIHEAEIVKWLVEPGDAVAVDQPILEIQTDKATVEIPCPVAGRVRVLKATAGDLVPVGTVVIEFEMPGDGSGSPASLAPHAAGVGVGVGLSSALNGRSAAGRRALAAPAVRKLARELAVDIQGVPGSGPNGRVVADDVRRAAGSRMVSPGRPSAAEPAAPTPQITAADAETRIPLRGTRRAIAEHMVRSKFTAPHVSTMDEVEVSELVALRSQMKESLAGTEVKMTYLPFVIKAVVAALREFPYLNASLDDQTHEIVLKSYYHIGIAVDDPDGLVVPVLRNADQKSLKQLAVEIQDVTERAHRHALTRDELSGSTFTLTNYGSFGGLYATPVINYPEVAIFGTGRIQKRAIVLPDDSIVARPVMTVSLTFDHRVVDGGMAGRFTNQVMRLLNRPADLFLEMS